jgi:hypothetical protein
VGWRPNAQRAGGQNGRVRGGISEGHAQMIDRAMSLACWVGWAMLMVGMARVGWWVVMHL